MSEQERLLLRAYQAFNARDDEAALALLHPDVDWPNGIPYGAAPARACPEKARPPRRDRAALEWR
jgi:hypothetical protein